MSNPYRDSEPEAYVAVVRGQIRDDLDHHPGPADVGLCVEVADSGPADDRAMAATYGGDGIPVYWIVNVAGRQLEVYANPAGARIQLPRSWQRKILPTIPPGAPPPLVAE